MPCNRRRVIRQLTRQGRVCELLETRTHEKDSTVSIYVLMSTYLLYKLRCDTHARKFQSCVETVNVFKGS